MSLFQGSSEISTFRSLPSFRVYFGTVYCPHHYRVWTLLQKLKMPVNLSVQRQTGSGWSARSTAVATVFWKKVMGCKYLCSPHFNSKQNLSQFLNIDLSLFLLLLHPAEQNWFIKLEIISLFWSLMMTVLLFTCVAYNDSKQWSGQTERP